MDHRLLQVSPIALLLMVGLAAGCQKSEEAKLDTQTEEAFTGEPKTVVAKVGKAEILLVDVDRVAGLMKSAGVPGTAEDSPRGLQRRALDTLVERELLLAGSREAGKYPSDEQVQQAEQELRSGFPSPEAYQNALAQQGLTQEEFHRRMIEDMAIRQFLGQVAPDTARVNPEEVRAFYEMHPEYFDRGERLQTSHILVAVSQGDSTRARAKADSLLAALRSGASFEELARTSSDCPSGQRGGRLDEFGRGQMVPQFERAAYNLSPGEISDVVRTQFGYHIIQLHGRVPARTIPFEEVRDRIAVQLRGERQNQAVRSQIEALRSKASIERKL